MNRGDASVASAAIDRIMDAMRGLDFAQKMTSLEAAMARLIVEEDPAAVGHARTILMIAEHMPIMIRGEYMRIIGSAN